MKRVLRWIAFLIVAALVGTLADELFHHRPQALEYPNGHQEWYVPVIFASAALACLLGGRIAERIRPAPAETADRTLVLHDLLWLLAAYAASGWLARKPWLDFAVLAVAFLLRLPWRISANTAIVVLAATVGGPLVEVVLTRMGLFAWDPTRALAIGIPVWLPVLYLHVGLLAQSASRWFDTIEENG